ncbi:hypothetical protein LENED_006021 [Lentinula edodes]|uniref:Uncharacterized protein n=1 Tax=Lentinula edodes TaxID=5353 RepID=A0A1Q3EAL7_LENED|nr:hypothetical protein LENED_006021 [Lentinula edodes]
MMAQRFELKLQHVAHSLQKSHDLSRSRKEGHIHQDQTHLFAWEHTYSLYPSGDPRSQREFAENYAEAEEKEDVTKIEELPLIEGEAVSYMSKYNDFQESRYRQYTLVVDLR